MVSYIVTQMFRGKFAKTHGFTVQVLTALLYKSSEVRVLDILLTNEILLQARGAIHSLACCRAPGPKVLQKFVWIFQEAVSEMLPL